ncbi:MAG: CotH kinase family protein, partial [Flavobacteriaceae bacterium]|nr:CotH kinase family protein [Flavobacteriaceae bacterium]
DDFWLIPFWWNRLMEDPAFVTQLKARWNTLRGGALTESALLSKIDGYVATLEKSGAVNENFKTWQVLGIYVWPNNFIGNTYSDEANYLKNWVKSRLNWMDSAINGL